jgi:hypothetical protein
MWSRSIGPASAGNGTTGTPAIRPPTTATIVSSPATACTATARAPAIRSATAVAAPRRPSHDVDRSATVTASGRSPDVPDSAGNNVIAHVAFPTRVV